MDSKTRAQIAQQVYDIRTERKLSQREVAEAIGVSTNTVGNMERGQSWPQQAHLRALLGYLGIDLPDPDEEEQPMTTEDEELDFPPDVRTALDTWGLHLERYEPEERARRIRAITRAILSGQF